MAMTKKEDAAPADPMDRRSEFDHETGKLSEPEVGDDPKVKIHDVEPVRDSNMYEDQGNGPVPRRADPFAHQRDQQAAKKAGLEDQKKSAAAHKDDDQKDGDKK